jgi:hypothetical protein
LKEPPNPSVFPELVINFGPAAIAEVTGNEGRNCTSHKEAERSQEDLMAF